LEVKQKLFFILKECGHNNQNMEAKFHVGDIIVRIDEIERYYDFEIKEHRRRKLIKIFEDECRND
jgi:hypothetical protein